MSEKDFVCNKDTLTAKPPKWRNAVKIQLIHKDMTQQNLVDMLQAKGYKISKQVLSQMLRGFCHSTRKAEIHEINQILGIPEEEGDEQS